MHLSENGLANQHWVVLNNRYQDVCCSHTHSHVNVPQSIIDDTEQAMVEEVDIQRLPGRGLHGLGDRTALLNEQHSLFSLLCLGIMGRKDAKEIHEESRT